MEFGIEERRTAIEIIATLVHIKSTLAEMILKPAGVPVEVYRPLLYKVDPSTGKRLSKRQIAPLILDELGTRGMEEECVRALLRIAAKWDGFHLADNEFEARATVQKAREVTGQIELMEAREARQRELAREEELRSLERERLEFLEKNSLRLLMMLEASAEQTDHNRRGYLLQELFAQLFDIHRIPVIRSFTRNNRAEQIDGAFKLDGWHYIVECRWRQKLADIRELDGLKGQVDRSGKQTMGLFVSINGWSDNVTRLLKQNPEKSILLMHGHDVWLVLSKQLDLKHFLLEKVAKLSIESEPFFSASEYLRGSNKGAA